MRSKRTYKHEKLARLYDDQILPIWAQRFGRMMLRGLDVPPKAMVLDVACGTGYPALEVLRRMDEQSRLIAIDSSSAMLDVARRKAGELSGKRIFFRTESASPRLSFADGVYDLVLCNLGLSELPNPRAALRDFVRVAKPGGRVLCTLPLSGTWGEFHDIYREVLVKHDKHEILERLDAHVRSFPRAEDVEAWARSVGLHEARVEVEEFSLLFRSSREFFFAPVVEFGPLPKWKEIAGRGQEMQDVFWHIKQAIDAYFGGRAFQVTVVAGCLRGVKSDVAEDAPTSETERFDAEDEWYSVRTDEVEMLEPEEAAAIGGGVGDEAGRGGDEDGEEEAEEELEAFRDDERQEKE